MRNEISPTYGRAPILDLIAGMLELGATYARDANDALRRQDDALVAENLRRLRFSIVEAARTFNEIGDGART
jgi:hypothetical protein